MQLLPQIAIDFGSDTVRAVQSDGEIYRCPALVVQNVETKKITAVGGAVAEHTLAPAEEIVRPMQSGRLVAYAPAVSLLEHVLEATLSWWQILKPQVLLSKSAFVSPAREEVLGDVFREAGAGKLYAARSVILAGFGAGVEPSDSRGQLVVNIGRETTEAAILSRGSVIHSTSQSVGGSDLVAALVRHVRAQYEADLPDNTASRAITEVGAAVAPDHDEAIEVFVTGKKSNERRELVLTSGEIAEAIAPTLEEIGDVVAELIKAAPTTLLSDITERGMYLTGGAGNLSHIDTYFSRQFSLEATVVTTPEEAVIRGGQEALSFINLYKQSMPQ